MNFPPWKGKEEREREKEQASSLGPMLVTSSAIIFLCRDSALSLVLQYAIEHNEIFVVLQNCNIGEKYQT